MASVCAGLLSLLSCAKPSDSAFAVGDTVVLNAIGVGRIDRRGESKGQTGYFVSFKWLGEQGFVPAERAHPLLRRPVTVDQAKQMLASITAPGASSIGAEPKAWLREMTQLWADADHLAQADYWGQVLRSADASPELRESVLAVTLGNHHLVEEIALLLDRSPKDVQSEIEDRRYPWLGKLLPPSQPRSPLP
jgi:hypothetical protein